MSSDHFVELYTYDSAANQKLLEQLTDMASTDKANETLAHLLAAKQVWMSRLEGTESSIDIWPDLTWKACEELIDKNRKNYNSFLSRLSDNELKRKVRYQNSKGKKFETPVRDILSHVLIHGGHHRGQIAKDIREAGETPINTDYITYVRNKSD